MTITLPCGKTYDLTSENRKKILLVVEVHRKVCSKCVAATPKELKELKRLLGLL